MKRNFLYLLVILAFTKLIPGRGPLSTMQELHEFHLMLLETSRIVEERIGAGESLEQIKSEGLPGRWKTWEAPTLSTGRWIEILYQGLAGKNSKP